MLKDYMTMREAREYLGISRIKMGKLVKESILKTYEDPLDKRVILVKKEDIDKLKTPKLRI